MQYLPTVNLWDRAISAAVRTGRLTLQTGQWVRCGDAKPSRFVALRKGGTIWAAHPEGEKGTRDSFRRLLQAAGR